MEVRANAEEWEVDTGAVCVMCHADTQANGGNCAVAWEAVCAPKWAGGLGIPNLQWLNVAMQARWPWLQRVDGNKPWSEFTIKVPKESMQIFWAATRAEARDGRTTLF